MSTHVHGEKTTLVARRPPLDAAQMAARQRRWGFWSVTRWRLVVMRSYRWSVLVTALGNPLLYVLAMGLGLGTLVNANGQQVDGVSYLVFVCPALMASTVVVSASTELSYPVMEGFRWDRLYQGPLATPVSPAQIAVGHHLAVTLRLLVQAGIFWLVMLAFGAAPSGWSWLTVPVTVLAASSFGAPLQAYAATLEQERGQFAFVERFIVMPMMLFSGTYYPLSVLPVYLQPIGWLSPVWHGTQLCRVASYGAVESGWLVGLHLVFLVVTAAGGMGAAVHFYRRRLGS